VLRSLEKVWIRCRGTNAECPKEFLGWQFEFSQMLQLVQCIKINNIPENCDPIGIKALVSKRQYRQGGEKYIRATYALCPTTRWCFQMYIWTPPCSRAHARGCRLGFFIGHSLFEIMPPIGDPDGHFEKNRYSGGTFIQGQRLGVFDWIGGCGILACWSSEKSFLMRKRKPQHNKFGIPFRLKRKSQVVETFWSCLLQIFVGPKLRHEHGLKFFLMLSPSRMLLERENLMKLVVNDLYQIPLPTCSDQETGLPGLGSGFRKY